MQNEIHAAKVVLSRFSIPPLPDAIIELQQAIAAKHPNTVTIAAIIGRNPDVLADFLKLANKCCAPKEPIKDARSAVNMLGMSELENLFLSVQLIDQLSQDEFERRMLDFSIKSGLAAAELAYWVYEVSRTEAYMAGLLQNIGAVYMYRYDAANFERLYEQEIVLPFSTYSKELQRYRTSHSHLGVILAKKWGIDSAIAKAVLLHHDMDFILRAAHHPKVKQLTALILMANFIVIEAMDDEYIHAELKHMKELANQVLELPDTALKAALSAVNKWGSSGLTLGSH